MLIIRILPLCANAEWTLSTILCKWKQDSVVSSSYIWILFSNISINWFIINPQL